METNGGSGGAAEEQLQSCLGMTRPSAFSIDEVDAEKVAVLSLSFWQ